MVALRGGWPKNMTMSANENIKKVHALNWFEIHAADLNRAKAFYEAILSIKMELVQFGDLQEAVFPFDRSQHGVGGSILVKNEPRGAGTLIYLNADGNLDDILGRVTAAGGAIVKPRTEIGPYGFVGIIKDTEGNVVGLHSRS
jgi:uncharacterized protein